MFQACTLDGISQELADTPTPTCRTRNPHLAGRRMPNSRHLGQEEEAKTCERCRASKVKVSLIARARLHIYTVETP